MRPLIFDIQRFSIHDGPGIRTVVFFKGCNLECPWCQNPESMALFPELAFYPDACTRCGDCVDICEEQAITLNGQLKIERTACTLCGKCADVCLPEALKIIGREYSADVVMNEILRDLDYYQDSGGGVTFSGGEPTLHADFLLQVLPRCKANGIHTNIETNGYFSQEKFERLLPYLDLIYFDLKILNQEKNRDVLGGDSERIWNNMKFLLDRQAPVEFRIPLVPGYTDDPDNLQGIIGLLAENGIENVHLLPYHSMGESKADKIGSPLPRLGLTPYRTEELERIRSAFEDHHIHTVLYR